MILSRMSLQLPIVWEKQHFKDLLTSDNGPINKLGMRMNLFFVCPAKCNKGFVFFMLLWITQNSWCSGEKCSSKWLILFVFAAEQQFCCNELTILNLIPTNSWWWDLHTITPKYKTELLNAVTGSGVRANSDNVCISGAGWADAGYHGAGLSRCQPYSELA